MFDRALIIAPSGALYLFDDMVDNLMRKHHDQLNKDIDTLAKQIGVSPITLMPNESMPNESRLLKRLLEHTRDTQKKTERCEWDMYYPKPFLGMAVIGLSSYYEQLLSRFPDLCLNDAIDGESTTQTIIEANVLSYAAKNDNVVLIERYIRLGYDLNHPSSQGITATYVAAHNGALKALECLLKHGANPERTDSNGRTAAFAALSTGKLEALKLLGGYGANFNIQDNTGKTLLETAEPSNCATHIISEYLPEEKPSPKKRAIPTTKTSTLENNSMFSKSSSSSQTSENRRNTRAKTRHATSIQNAQPSEEQEKKYDNTFRLSIIPKPPC